MTQRGFTLIELLVVIAIIGILAATVLASLGTARQSGSDASIQSTVNATKAQAELYYSTNNNSYAGVCGAGTNSLTTLLTSLVNTSTSTSDTAATTTAAMTNTIYCNADTNRWVVAAPLAAGGSFCSDSTGYSGKRPLLTAGVYACN